MHAEKFKNKNVCITGGLGFIGSAIARKLANIANVTVIDSLIPEYGGNIFNVNNCKEKLDIKLWDVRDIEKLEHVFCDADYIFNMAGQTSHMDSMTDPYTDLEINKRFATKIFS